MHARGSGEAARRAKRLAPSVTRVALCVSRSLLDGLQKKERLLVVYSFSSAPSVTRVALCVSRALLDGLQKEERLLVVYIFARFYRTSLERGTFPNFKVLLPAVSMDIR